MNHINPKWQEEYSFRIWPARVDEKFLTSLPDPNREFGIYLVVPDEWLESVIFKRIPIYIKYSTKIVLVYDWEQVH